MTIYTRAYFIPEGSIGDVVSTYFEFQNEGDTLFHFFGVTIGTEASSISAAGDCPPFFS
jgi:hypothetical protein